MRINRTLTKDYILEKIDEIDIFSEYLNVDDRDIERCISDDLLICSPLRVDEEPTVGFRYNKRGRLKMRDFAGYFWGDCFDLVAYIYGLSVNNKDDFYRILYDIAVRFGLIVDKEYKEHHIAVTKKRSKVIRKGGKHKIEFKARAWNKSDLDYWKVIFKNEQYCSKYLDYFKVYPVDYYWIDIDSQPEPKYYYKRNDPCYAYYFGKDAKGIDDIKLYFPMRKHNGKLPRFITNSNNIGGLDYLPPKVDYLLITKSYKDMCSLYSFITPMNPRVGIITLVSESTPLSEIEYNDLADKVIKTFRNTDIKAVFTLLDFDLTGIRMSNKMRKEFKTIPFFLTNGRFSTIDYEGKDFTDTIVEKGKNFIENLVNSTLIEINKLLKI